MKECILALALFISFSGCKSESEQERERREQPVDTQRGPNTATDGSIRLTPDDIRINNIQTAPVVEQQIAPTITVAGRIKPRAGAESRVFPAFAGRITTDSAHLPRLGGEVQAGQLLAELEQILAAPERIQFKAAALQLQTEIDHARQEMDLRRKELDRGRQLYEGGAIALKELQSAEFSLNQAQTKLEGAERAKAEYDLSVAQRSEQGRTEIRAPISGTVTAIDLISGQQVDPSKSLLTIVNTTAVWAELAVAESELAEVRRTSSAEIVVPSDPKGIYSGHLVSIGVAVDPENRTVPITFDLSNTDSSLKLDMFVEGHIPTGPPRKAELIPASAILLDQGVASVFVETAPRIFSRRIVMLGQRTGTNVEILRGVQPNEQVVSTGAQVLNSETLKNLIPKDEEGGKR